MFPTIHRPGLGGMASGHASTALTRKEERWQPPPCHHKPLARCSQAGGPYISPSELEELAPHLETLSRDLHTLASVDLGEVEPETLFDVQGE